ncbi:hypothetical protein CAPTEDRAFT_21390 [Capitella teleta]|uniref:Proteasome assembly chaperone 4 n=1 Tax=Capitella teleta TaxID=283909 RepID=R7UJI8_CAPTE|nr:hypothetical protein CAPTEDRAFT_21390 [Capitella teleta]|eukprot:ELU06278.1 hypothetical protein CAPTEDRAFT_21390 [Capitella teleta]
MDEVEGVSCRLGTHEFQEGIDGSVVVFHVMAMLDSLFIWIGNQQPSNFSNLALAMHTKYETGATALNIFGKDTDSTSSNIAKKIASKTKKQIYVSYNLASDETPMLSAVELRLMQEMKDRPECF